MFEVERKFILDPEQEAQLTEAAEFVSETTRTDVYYDTPNYDLTRRDRWLRTRNDRWELKIPVHMNLERGADQYAEIDDELELRGALYLPLGGELRQVLNERRIVPFATLPIVRREYRLGLFTIDLDKTEFGDDSPAYSLAEIELMVNNQDDIPEAVERILEVAGMYKLSTAPVRGKVIEYLYRTRPEHFQALVEAGVVAPPE